MQSSVITFKKLHFLRPELGRKTTPAIGDDIAVYKMEPDGIKCAGDPKEEDALLWARWGGVQFEQNQSRQFCANPFDVKFESQMKVLNNNGREEITFESFLRLIEVNWPKESTEADIEAYLNRFHMFVLGNEGVYYRYAGDSKANVPKLSWPIPAKPDLWIPEAIDIMKSYKKDQTFKPETYNEDFAWDLALMNALAAGRTIPRSITIQGPRLFGGSSTEYMYASMEQLTGPLPRAGEHAPLALSQPPRYYRGPG